jgi:hypothetical protein
MNVFLPWDDKLLYAFKLADSSFYRKDVAYYATAVIYECKMFIKLAPDLQNRRRQLQGQV